MAALNPEIIKDTAKLISLYKSNPTFREHFDNAVKRNVNATYNYRPLKLYFEVLASTNSPKYKAAYHQVRKLVKHDSEGIIGKIFMSVTPKDILYLNEFARKAERKENATDYSDDEIKEINEIEEKKENIENPSRKAAEHQKRVEAKTPEKLKEEEEANPKAEQEKEQAPIEEKPENELAQPTIQEEKARVEGVLNQSDEKIMETKTSYKGSGGQPIRNIYPKLSEPQISAPKVSEMPMEIQQESEGQPSLPSISISNIPGPSGFRNFASNSKTFFRGGVKAGGVVAKGAGRVAGTAIKAGAGAAAKLGASALLGAATGGVSLIFTFITSYGTLKDLFKLIFWIVIGLIAFIIVMFVFQRGEKMNSFLPPYDVPTMDSANGDITSCKFYRANEPASYKSNLLLSYISEASSLTGIPPVVLAAFIRVESPASVGKNDDQIRNYAASCVASEPGYVSETGALGIMQIQPPGTKSLKGDAASCEECIDAGAKLLGKTVQNMTVPDDYCDPRTNIIVGSGFILKKMEYLGYKNSGKWDPAWTNDQGAINALVNTYYGDLKYNDVNGNEQDYGVDVWTSIQNCKLTGSTSIVSCPLNGNRVISCGSYGSDPKFNRAACLGPNPNIRDDRGHCSKTYGTCAIERTYHSIDIDAPRGETVRLPQIEGKNVEWTSIGSYPVNSDGVDRGGGVGQIFNALVDGHRWELHLIHVDQNLIPPPPGKTYHSGDPVTRIDSQVYPKEPNHYYHLHVNIGKDTTYANGGPGWLDPESTGMCVNI